MVRDLEHIRAIELLHLFVLERGSLSAEQDDDPLAKWIASCAAQLEKNTDVTLRELFSKAEV